jgi:cellulose synthase operon protein C
MTSVCPYSEEILALADGERAGADGDAARAHLGTCFACQRELTELVQLVATEISTRPAAVVAAPPVAVRRPRARARWIAIGGAAVAVAAAAAGIVIVRRPAPAPTPPRVALAPTRAIEPRLTWGAAAAHRPYDVERGDRGDRGGNEPIELATLAELERAGDKHGVGALSLLAGERERAARNLSGETDAVVSDRAALALVDGDAETALSLTATVLERSASARAHGAARWNHALALRDLGLVRAAAEELRAIAGSTALDDAGWATEAGTRADTLAAAADARTAITSRVLAAGATLIQTGTGLSIDDARRAPGLARLYLYDAVRAAPSRERVLALRPLAEAVDAIDHGAEVTAAVDRAAAADFTRRAPLARSYAAMAAGTLPAGPARARFLADARAARQDDLVLGALLRFGPDGRTVAAADLPELVRLAGVTGDRWFALLAIEQEAAVRAAGGDLLGAEAVLAPAVDRCTSGGGIDYRCVKLAVALADVDVALHRNTEARAALAAGWRIAATRADGWLLAQTLIAALAELHAMRDDAGGSGLALTRAYARELVLRNPDSCAHRAWAGELVAMVLVNQLRIDDARRELADAPPCGDQPMSVRRLFVTAHVVRDGGTDADLAALRVEVERARATATPGQRALLDHVLGRALVDRDPAAGEAHLRAAIAAADALPASDVDARKARGYSYSVLALAAARRGDAGATLAALEAEAGVAIDRCVIGAAVEDGRWTAAARGADGTAVVAFGADRTPIDVRAGGLIPTAVLAQVAGCPIVDVIARPPVHGVAAMLPADRAWRYRTGVTRAAVVAPSGERAVVVAGVIPPARLGLAALPAPIGGGADELVDGADATPERVLAAIRDATWIELHAHGVIDAGSSDASYLALSPDAAGRYAITARDVRGERLTGAPVVALAACHGATGAGVVHEPSGLPSAFLAAGARAVIAADAAILDADAGAVFAELRAAIAGGADPATALRDVRRAWSGRPGAAWVDHLVVFE